MAVSANSPSSDTAEPMTAARARRRLMLVLWLLGLPGVLALLYHELPHWMRLLHWRMTPDLSFVWMFVPMALLLWLPVWLGVRLGPQVGLSAPVLAAWAERRSPRRALRYLGLPGVAGGIVGAAWMVTLAVVWPERLSQVDPVYAMPLWAKVWYGGVTEEIVMRFGSLTLVMWLLRRLQGREERGLAWPLAWCAIVLNAVLWVAIHQGLEVWSAQGTPNAGLIQILLCELVYGVMAGALFRCCGLEAAMCAHAIAYAFSHGLV